MEHAHRKFFTLSTALPHVLCKIKHSALDVNVIIALAWHHLVLYSPSWPCAFALFLYSTGNETIKFLQ